LDEDEIQLILSRHAGRLGRCVWPIWERYNAIAEVDRLTFDLTAEANVLNRYMIDFAKKEFSEVPGVQFFENNGFVLGVDGFQYGLSGQLACRFKKLNGDGRSRNNLSTCRARAVRNNSNEFLDGMPPEATWVDIGYVLNDLRTGIRDAQVVRIVGTKFVMSLPRENDGTISMPLPLPFGSDRGNSGSSPLFEILPRREGQSNSGDKPKDGN
jgi:hypothetical protein